MKSQSDGDRLFILFRNLGQPETISSIPCSPIEREKPSCTESRRTRWMSGIWLRCFTGTKSILTKFRERSISSLARHQTALVCDRIICASQAESPGLAGSDVSRLRGIFHALYSETSLWVLACCLRDEENQLRESWRKRQDGRMPSHDWRKGVDAWKRFCRDGARFK